MSVSDSAQKLADSGWSTFEFTFATLGGDSWQVIARRGDQKLSSIAPEASLAWEQVAKLAAESHSGLEGST